MIIDTYKSKLEVKTILKENKIDLASVKKVRQFHKGEFDISLNDGSSKTLKFEEK